MRFEAATLRQAPPDDPTERAYSVMNAVTTAWQMKDWEKAMPFIKRILAGYPL